jgi:CARDB protein
MRKRIVPLLLLAFALSAPAAARADGTASVRLKNCRTGSEPSKRSATFKSMMTAVPGSVRMGVHFHLIARFPGRSAQGVSAPALTVWHKSREGVTRYGYAQTVRKLKPGASYRMAARFRWYDADGNVIRRAKRLSSACVQNGDAPNLFVSAVSLATGTTPGTAEYAVSIGNSGKSPADGFTVALLVDGALADSRTVERLDPGEVETIKLNGPTCSRLRAVVDYYEVVAESSEDDNALRSRC